MGAPTPEPAERAFSPDGLAEDLAFLAETIAAVHPRPTVVPLVGSPEARSALERSLDRPTRRLDFCLRVAPLVNDSPDGHTFLRLPSDEFRRWAEAGGRLFPWELEFSAPRPGAADPSDRGGGVRARVLASHAPEADASVGDEVLAINGLPTPEVVRRLLPYPNGETPARRLLMLRHALGSLLRAVFGFDGPYRLTVRSGDGAEARTVAHPGVSDAGLRARRDEAANQDGEDAPAPYRYSSCPDQGVGVIDFRDFVDPERFETFLGETFAQVRREAVRGLVVDLRGNDGGYSLLGDLLLAYLADRPVTQYARCAVKVSRPIKELYRGAQARDRVADPAYEPVLAAPEGSLLTFPGTPVMPRPATERFSGGLYVLIGPATYSSATMLASAIKDHRLGVLVGEETGGAATQYGDMCPFTLPHTGLRGFVSHKWFLRPGGLDDGRGVLPDVETPAVSALARARALLAGTTAS